MLSTRNRIPCPIRTDRQCSLQEVRETDVPEIKAYKLGKKRWSYNQVDLILIEREGNRRLFSKQALHEGLASPALEDAGGVSYQITLSNDEVITLVSYLVYDAAHSEVNDSKVSHTWYLVARDHCKRQCHGPVLRAIQRFGKLGKRSGGTPTPTPGRSDNNAQNMKDGKFMYLSFDEAVTHVGCRTFRLISAAFDAKGELIGTSPSPPVRVLANNDVPTGAAHIEMHIEVDSSWYGWESCFVPSQLFPSLLAACIPNQEEVVLKPSGTPPRMSARLRAPQKRAPAPKIKKKDNRKSKSNKKEDPQVGANSEGKTINLTASSLEPPVRSWTEEECQEQQHQGHAIRSQPRGRGQDQHNASPLQRSDGSLALWLDETLAEADIAALNNEIQKKQQEVNHETHYSGWNPPYPDQHHNMYQNPHYYQHQMPYHKYPPPMHHQPIFVHPPNPRVLEDPVAAFVQLMMSHHALPATQVPIIEIPQVRKDEHPQNYFGQKELKTVDVKDQSMRQPDSPRLFNNLPGSLPGTPPSLATPTGSGLDSLLCGIHATFDSLVQDDAIYPPKQGLNPDYNPIRRI